jgi:formate hydrogenlyase subunit 4
MVPYLVEALQGLVALGLSPGLTGFVRLLKARMQGRSGPGILQPYRDLAKLLNKERVVSTQASWIFHAAPGILFSSTLTVGFLVPLVAAPLPLDRVGDLVVVVYLLLLGTFFLALAGLDTASAFGGMGSSRAMTIAALAEPTIALAIFGMAVGAGSTNLGEIVARTLSHPEATLGPGHLMAFAALFIVMLAETGRIPVDNPATHLELTMIHEAMILEYSGPYLALVEWAGQMKFFLFLALLSNLGFPWGVAVHLDPVSILAGVAALVLKIVVLATGLAVLETRLPKLRLFRVPELLGVSFLLALLAITSSFLVR